MKYLTTIVLLILLQFLCESAGAAECDDFVADLKDMKTAQESIQQSLISNHDMMAESLTTYADALKETKGKAYKRIVDNMTKAGESILKRKTKAQDIAKSFNQKAEEMVKTAEKCLRASK